MDYFSVKTQMQTEKVIERSRFITFVCPCDTEEAASAVLGERRRLYKTATHNCYAYVAEFGGYSRYSDDKEPSGTAGAPILEAIKSLNLTNVIVVVTRYFGGIKLGAGGLTRAYFNCASEGLKNAGVVKYTECYKLKTAMQYDDYQIFLRFMKGREALLEAPVYSDLVNVCLYLPASDYGAFEREFANVFCGRYIPEKTGIVHKALK